MMMTAIASDQCGAVLYVVCIRVYIDVSTAHTLYK